MNRRVITSFSLSPHSIATRPLLLILFAANLAVGVSALKAAVLFSQGSPTGDHPIGFSNGPSSGATLKNEAAEGFVLPAGGTPSTLQWFGGATFGPPLGSGEAFLLRLYSNGFSGSFPFGPSALLYEESTNVIGADAGNAGRSYSAPFTPGALAAGTTYFVSIVENDPSTSELGWGWGEFTNPAGSTIFGRSGESGIWGFTLGDQALDFTLLGSVAEPGSGVLLGIGALALAAAKARKRRFRRPL
jgi:hypothetical protein